MSALGRDPHLDERGKYQHRNWTERSFQWPQQAEKAISWVERSAPLGDVYLCPYLMRDRKRAKGNAAGHKLVHSDVDHGYLDRVTVADEVERLGGFTVRSGSPGNGHVYIELKYAVTAAQHEILCRGLAVRFGGDRAKISDNDLLRPPGAYNHKAACNGGEPTPVELVEPHTVVKVSPSALAELLGVDITNTDGRKSADDGTSSSQPSETEPVDLDAYPEVRKALDEFSDPPDRSVDTYRVVAAGIDNGLTLAQIRWIVRQRPDLVGRLDGRNDDDVLTSWDKITKNRAEHIRIIEEAAALATWPGHSGQLGMAYRLRKRFPDQLL